MTHALWSLVAVAVSLGVAATAQQEGGQTGQLPPLGADRQVGERAGQPVDNGIADLLHYEARILTPVIVRTSSDVASRRPPLLVVLHGRGASAYGLAGVWNALDEPKPILVLPSAPYVLLSGTEKKPALGGSWDMPTRDRKLWERADPLVTQYILQTVRSVRERYRAGGVYLMGHSQGVAYAYRAALQDPELVRGVIAMAGMLADEEVAAQTLAAASGKVRVFIAHGRKDEIVKPSTSTHAREVLERHGFTVTFREFDGGHEINLNVLREAQAWMMAQERGR